MDVADVPGVVVARDDDEGVAVDPLEVRARHVVLVLEPEVVRSPEQMTMSGWNSFTSEIARSSRFASKYGPPQWRSERWAMRNRRSPSAIARSLRSTHLAVTPAV